MAVWWLFHKNQAINVIDIPQIFLIQGASVCKPSSPLSNQWQVGLCCLEDRSQCTKPWAEEDWIASSNQGGKLWWLRRPTRIQSQFWRVQNQRDVSLFRGQLYLSKWEKGLTKVWNLFACWLSRGEGRTSKYKVTDVMLSPCPDLVLDQEKIILLP